METNENLTKEELEEYSLLKYLQADKQRWFTKEEFNRLRELSEKRFKTKAIQKQTNQDNHGNKKD